MKITMQSILKNKFNIDNPKKILDEIKSVGNIDNRTLKKLLLDIEPYQFNLESIKKFVLFFIVNNKKKGLVYKPEYWMYRLNISFEEATQKVKEYKQNKVTSKAGFIRRHGKQKGEEIFKNFQETSKYSSSDEWFKNKYGDDWKDKKEYELRRRSLRCCEYWIEKGYSEDEAKQKVLEYQLSTSGVHKEYYKNKGYNDDEIELILREIKVKKTQHIRNTKFLKEKYPDKWKEIYENAAEKYRKRMEELGVWIERGVVDDFKKYKSLVTFYTNRSLLYYGELLDDLNLRSKSYHLDHKYSIKMGFINDIDPKIIGSIINLEIMPSSINCKKRAKCSITKQFLLEEYQKFKENYEN